jgi:CheY-like chemotaxis protein
MVDGAEIDRLLVIDDEPGFGRVVERVGRAVGFDVSLTEDAAVFTNTARLWHPSVIFLDLKMPSTDGIQLLRTLAADKCAAHIVLTSGVDEKVLNSAVQLGRERGLDMREPLPKPVGLDALRQRLLGYKRVRFHPGDIELAVGRDQLFLEYQPKLDTRRRRLQAPRRWCGGSTRFAAGSRRITLSALPRRRASSAK